MDGGENSAQLIKCYCQQAQTHHIHINRYGKTRYWAVWVNGDLLAVTVYKKGAIAIRDKLSSMAPGF